MEGRSFVSCSLIGASLPSETNLGHVFHLKKENMCVKSETIHAPLQAPQFILEPLGIMHFCNFRQIEGDIDDRDEIVGPR